MEGVDSTEAVGVGAVAGADVVGVVDGAVAWGWPVEYAAENVNKVMAESFIQGANLIDIVDWNVW